jgi:peptidoglycan-associated lipoprotein
MHSGQLALLLSVSGVFIACSSEPRRPPVAPGAGTEGQSARPSAIDSDPKSPTRSQIKISEDIQRACGISEADAHFAFDSARVQNGYYPVLEKLAFCFSKGALSGRRMQLVGHADPRGETEYNLLLGGRRADNVRSFLIRVGVTQTQIATSSRGEYDARGKDEASWAQDRRVDVLLAN